jgi:hypothetical protein
MGNMACSSLERGFVAKVAAPNRKFAISVPKHYKKTDSNETIAAALVKVTLPKHQS